MELMGFVTEYWIEVLFSLIIAVFGWLYKR